MSAGYQFKNIKAPGTENLIVERSGLLHSIVINDPGLAGTAIVYDSSAGTPGTADTKVATLTTATAAGAATLNFDCRLKNGLAVVTSGTADITVIYE